MPSSDYTPAVADVAVFLRTRTRDTNGVELGTFTIATRPTAAEVEAIIADTVVNMEDDLGTDIDQRLWSSAKRVTALRAAMAIEVSYFSEQVAADRSVYPQLKEWYEEDLDKLNSSIIETAEGGDIGSDAGENTPLWGGGDLPFTMREGFPLFVGDLSGWSTWPEAIGAFHRSNSAEVTARSIDTTGFVDDAGVARQIKYAPIDAASIGNNILLAAVPSRKLRVHSLYLVSSGVTTVCFQSGISGGFLSGQMNLVSNSGFVLPHNPHGWFETAAGILLNLVLSAAVSVDGSLTYSEVG